MVSVPVVNLESVYSNLTFNHKLSVEILTNNQSNRTNTITNLKNLKAISNIEKSLFFAYVTPISGSRTSTRGIGSQSFNTV